MDSLRVYFKLISISFQSRMQFQGDFFVGVVAVLVLNAVNLGSIGVILSRFENLSGWTIWEIVFLYSFWVLGHSIFSLLFWHLEDLEFYLIEGTFDQFLIRPISPFLQFLGREINYPGVADVIVGLAGMVLALQHLRPQWSSWGWLLFFLFIISGTLIEFSITLALACVAFWTGRSAAATNTALNFSFLIQQYPLDMFGRWFRVFVTAVVPVAFINFYPARLLLGKITSNDPWSWLSYAAPFVALILLCLAALVWKAALRQYSSSGS